ncbi:hypothetical protein [Nocardioides stalactiti]|uniref:hypothetical protein n=1 Tax=Nocardioides stalactiti TaxID=2755356 RepID=UPI0016034068|nr:hypothetical protein [Nocardioides stalactiti]
MTRPATTGPRTEWLGSWRVRLALLAALVATGLVPVLTDHGRWLGSWKVALDTATFSVTLLGPCAAGIAATIYVRVRRSQVADLFAASPRPWQAWLAPAVGVWLLATLGLVLIALFTTATAWLAGAYAEPALAWILLATSAVIAAQVAIGALIGGTTGQYWSAPWAAVATFTLFILTSIGVIPVVFRTGGVSGALAGETFDPATFAFQAVVAVGLAAGAMALSHRDLFALASRGGKALTVLTALTAVVALLGFSHGRERYVPASSVTYECREGRPTVCLPRDARRPLGDLFVQAQEVARHLEAAGAVVPARFVATPPGVSPEPGDGVIHFQDDEDLAAHVDVLVAARSLATPARCGAFFSDDPRALPDTYFPTFRALVGWLLVQVGEVSPPADEEGWWRLPVTQQRPWVRATYDALADCRLGDLHPPEVR